MDTALKTDSTPIFDNAIDREKSFPLEWPFTLDGVHHTHVKLKRATARQMNEYFIRIDGMTEDEAKNVLLPVFDTTPEIFGALDADDADMLDKAAYDFLPKRYRKPQTEHTPDSGDE